MPTPTGRIIVDWQMPLVPQAAAALLDRATSHAGTPIDLSDLRCVVPGNRSARLLLSQLATLGRARGRSVIPPRVVTPGALVEELGDPTSIDGGTLAPMAPPLARLVAWASALESCDDADRARLGLGLDGRPADVHARIELARALCAVSDDLAAEERTFADGRAAASRLAGDREAERFAAAARVADAAAALLSASGLAEPSRAQSRLAASAAPRDRGPRQLVLVATIELNATQRRAVATFQSRGGAVLVITHADETWRSRFDELGCIVPGAWIDEPRAIHDDEIVVAERASDAAQCAIEAIATVADQRSADEITIGLVDPDLGALLDQAARWAGLSLRPAAGRALPSTGPWQVMATLAGGATTDEQLLRLARLPPMERAFRASAPDETTSRRDLLEALDEAVRAARPGGERCDRSALVAARRALAGLVAQLAGPPRRLDEWRAPIGAMLAEVLRGDADDAPDRVGYSDHPDHPDHADHPVHPDHVDRAGLVGLLGDGANSETSDDASIDAAAIEAIAEELASWLALPAALSPMMDGWTALSLLVDRTRGLSAPLPRRRGEIDALGWLELHFDDAPVLIVVGAHEGRLPRSAPRESTGLMPESLRAELGLSDGRALACRDAYLFEAMRRGRAMSRVIMARRDASGAPVLASRFLVNAPPAERALRLRRMARPAEAVRVHEPAGLAAPSAASRFTIPPAPTGPIELQRIPVTAFKTLLACRYRAWLRWVVGLQAVDPPGPQLGPDEFGTLAHDVLRRFGEETAIRDSTSAERIAAFLDSALEEETRRHFGSSAPIAVRVQAARLRERLAAFASMQAARRRDGWRIDRVEWSLPATALLAIDGEPPVRVTGRIDRIDRHDDGRTMLLDYKTADTLRSPRKVHRGAERRDPAAPWLDLQLPLYAHLWSLVENAPLPETGYMVLPRDPADVAVAPFDLDADELAEAIDNAGGVVALLRRGGFSPAADFAGRDDFATICHARSLGRVMGDERGDPAEGDFDVDGGDGS